MNCTSDRQFRQTSLPAMPSMPSPTPSKELNTANISPNKSESHDLIFVRVKDWSQCSRCLWHLEHLLNENIDINLKSPNEYDHELEREATASTTEHNDDGDTSNNINIVWNDNTSMESLSPLRLNPESPQAMMSTSLGLGSEMIKSRSLPNIPNIEENHKDNNHRHTPILTHYAYANKYHVLRRDRLYDIDKKHLAQQCLDNVLPVGYGSIETECKDYNNKIITLSQTTSLRFLYEYYRIVITLDISSSIGVMNPTTRCIQFEHYYPMLRDFLLLITQPMDFECLGSNGPIFPTLYLMIIAVGLPSKQLVLLLNDEIKCSYNTFCVDNLIKRLYDEFQKLQQNIVSELRETHYKQKKALNVDWEDIIHHSLFCLDRMPIIGCPNIVVITDGMLSLANYTTTYGAGVLAQVLRRDVSVNTLQTTLRQFSANAPFGHVPDSDLLEFFCRFTNGILVDHNTLHQQYEARFGADTIDNDANIDDRYNKLRLNNNMYTESHSEFEKAAMFSQFHHFKHKKKELNIDEEEDIDDDDDNDDIYYNTDNTCNVDIHVRDKEKVIPAKWFRNKVDSLFMNDNLVQLGVLVRSSSLSNQVFESSASTMLASWYTLVQSHNHNKLHKLHKLHKLPDPLLMGHAERVQWYKTSYVVNLSRSVLIRARTNEGFKNANIICKGDYCYYNHGHYMDNFDTASIHSNDSRYPLESNQIIHMFHEWKHRVVIEYQMIFAATVNQYEQTQTKVNIFIIGSISFLTNLVKYLAQNFNDKSQNIRCQQFAELEAFIHDIKRMDKALSNLVFHHKEPQPQQKRKFSSLLNYLEQKIWHDVVFQDVICVPKLGYNMYKNKKKFKIKTLIENLQMNTPNVWQKVRDALKQWSTFDLEYHNQQIIKYVRSFHEYGGFAVVVFEQLHECDWLISLKIEAQGPVSRRLYILIRDSVVRLIQQIVCTDEYTLMFLEKPIHNLLLFDFNDCSKCNEDEHHQQLPHMHSKPDYIQEIQLIRSYLHTYCWLIVIPSKSYIRNVMSMFTDLKLREGFTLIMNHSNGRILGHWIESESNNNNMGGRGAQTSFVQININKIAKGLQIELAVEPTPCKYTFGAQTLGTKDLLHHLKQWTQGNIHKILSIVGSFYASSRTIKEIRINKQSQLLNLRISTSIAREISTYNSESESDDHGAGLMASISNKYMSQTPLVSTPQPVQRQNSGSRLTTPTGKKRLRRLKPKRKKSSKASKLGAKRKSVKLQQTPKLRRPSSVTECSPHSVVGGGPQQSVVFDFKKKESILCNEDVFKGCDMRYKAKLNEITLYGADTVREFIPLIQSESKEELVFDEYSLEPLDVLVEILKHCDVNHRVFPYELDYHRTILNNDDDCMKSKIETSAQLLLKLLLKTVKGIADIEIITDRIYCYDITPSKETVIDSYNLLYIVLPSRIHPIPKLDQLLNRFKPIGENYSDYLYLFEVSKQIVSTTQHSLYDEKDYGIIADIMRYIPYRKPVDFGSDNSNPGTPSLSAITPRSMLDHCLSRLRQNHARNKARIIYFDLINQINVPLNRIEFAMNKCSQFREDFNISLLKKLMLAPPKKAADCQDCNAETVQFADKLLSAVEATCKAQFKYIAQLDAYFYIPMNYKHQFADESNTESKESKCMVDEEEEDVREAIHSSSANDADLNESLDEDIEGSDSSDDDHMNDDIPQSESEKLKTTTLSVQEKRMHRRAKLRVRKSGNMTPNPQFYDSRENAFTSMFSAIYADIYNQSPDSMLMAMDHASSAPPPEAFASPFDNAVSIPPIVTSVRCKRSLSSPIQPPVDIFDDMIQSIVQSSLPYPLFIRFNVIIHGTANRFRSVSVNDIKKEALYTQQCSAICLNAIIMTTPPNSVSMGLDTSMVSFDDINSLSMDQFNDAPFMHSSHSMTTLNANNNNTVPALDTKNINKLPVMFVGLYRRFSRSLRAQIAKTVLHQLRTSKPIDSEMVLQQLSLLQPQQFHLFSHIVRFIDKRRCFDLLPIYMAKCIIADIRLEKVNLNLNFSPYHKSHLWFAMKVEEEGGPRIEEDSGAEGTYDDCSIPYWVFICISEDVNNTVNTSFIVHIHPDDAALCKIEVIEQKFRDYIQRTQFLINQQALLQELNETKIINRFLIPIEENYNEEENTADSAFDMFKPGQFEAKQQLILPFIIHRRVDPRKAKYQLEQILIRMRCGTTDIFVFRERSGNIFYFKCEVAHFDQSYHINDETIIEQEHDDETRPCSKPMTQTTGTSMIRFIFYGQTAPGEQITKELKQTLEDQLGDFTQRTMITLLQKNPKFLFNHIDYRFLCPSNGSPKSSRCYVLPEFVSDLYLFTLLLKQNIATHLGIHSIRITPDENRLSFDCHSLFSEDSKDHGSPTPGTEGKDTYTFELMLPKTFRVKISSEDISFVYFTLPPLYRERKYKRKQRKTRSIHSNTIAIDSNNNSYNTTTITDSGVSSTTNKRLLHRLQQPTPNETITTPSPQFDGDIMEEDSIYKLGQSFGNGLAVLTCGFIKTATREYISHARTHINPMKSNNLSCMRINPDRSLKSVASMLQNISIVEAQELETIKGGYLRVWKSTTSILRQQLNALQQTLPPLSALQSITPIPSPNLSPNPPFPIPILMKHESNSTFFGSASPRELETDFDSYCCASSGGIVEESGIITDDSDDSDLAQDDSDDEDEEKEIEQRTFAIELWSRSDSAINTNELLTQFNAAINQSLHEYGIEWLCVLFRNSLIDCADMLYSYLIKPIIAAMSSCITLSAKTSNFKSKSCHCFQHSFPRMFWGLNKVAQSVLLQLSHTLPSMPVYVLTRGTTQRIETRAQFMSANHCKCIYLDEISATYVIIGGIRIFGDTCDAYVSSKRRSSSTERDKIRHKLYGPKRLSSTRSSLLRHYLFIGFIEHDHMTLYHYNICVDKIRTFQSKMDQLTAIIQDRCTTFNSIMLNRMGLSWSTSRANVLKSRSRTTSRESTVRLRSMKSATTATTGSTVDSLEMESNHANVFESLWSTPHLNISDFETDCICGVSKRTLYELGMPNISPMESLPHSPLLTHVCAIPSMSALAISRSEPITMATQKKRQHNMNAKRNSYCITKDPMDIHFLITEKRLKEYEEHTMELNHISSIISRAKYLNELIIDHNNIHWRSKIWEFKKYCLKIHEIHCPFLIWIESESESIDYISSVFIADLCKYVEKNMLSVGRLVNCLFYNFKMDEIWRQILIIPSLSMNEVGCTFYLLPQTAYSASLSNNISQRYSLQTQEQYLIHILEELQSSMLMHLTAFVSEWCKQLLIQILVDDEALLMNDINWKQSIEALFISNEEIHYEMAIPKHRKYVNEKETLMMRKPLLEWFGRYGFNILPHHNLAFIVSDHCCFQFEGNRYAKQMYHSPLTETAIIVLIFGKVRIDSFYFEYNCANCIQLKLNHDVDHDENQRILQYLNAPSLNTIPNRTRSYNRMPIVSQSPSLSELLMFINEDESHETDEKKGEIPATSLSISMSMNINDDSQTTKQITKEIPKRKRRWSLSDCDDVEELLNDNDSFSYSLISQIMRVFLVEIVTDIVSLWYVLPDCELTFLSIIDAMDYCNEHEIYYLSSNYSALSVSEIDISRLKKLRKYYWRKPFKYVVQQFLADSAKECDALITILSNLQSAVICDDPLLSFESFINLCKNNDAIGALTISIDIIASSSTHLFILMHPPLCLIHFFLSQNKGNNLNEEGLDKNCKLVMEVIGTINPKKSIINRQCLNDLIHIISLFLKKRKKT